MDSSVEVTSGGGDYGFSSNQSSPNKYRDPIQLIKDFTYRKKQPEKEETLLPTLPNLYGLDVRFRYVERQMKEEKDRRSVRGTTNTADSEFLSEMFGYNSKIDQTPINRHGNLIFDSARKLK